MITDIRKSQETVPQAVEHCCKVYITEATSGHEVDNKIFTLCPPVQPTAWSVQKHTEKEVRLAVFVLQILHRGKASLR